MSKGREKLTWGGMQEHPKEGMDVKEEVIPCSLMRDIYMEFTSIHLVPVAFYPIPHSNLLDSHGRTQTGVFSEVG